ncbi:MAG: ATP-binding cassette domain-containing protein [archaeon]
MLSIKADNLVKKFGDFVAVNDLSLGVFEGELFGLLGPNGAGKTTTINMLSTLLKPTSGSIEVAGFNTSTNSTNVRKHIGIVFQETTLDTKLTGYENLDFHSRMYGLKKEERKKSIKEVLEIVELADKANILVENYSGGMKRRLEIARALIQKPKVLFLDEPTIGLDAQTRRNIWDYIKKLNKKDVTIILTTHYMEEADYLCDRIAIVDHGKIISLDTPANLKNSVSTDVIVLEISNQSQDIEGFLELLKKINWIKAIKWKSGMLHLNIKEGSKRIPKLIKLASNFNVIISSVNLHKPSLEDVFLKLTGKTIREEDLQPEKVRPMI